MNLLIDIGNSRLKWAISDKQQLTVGLSIVNQQIDKLLLIETWQAINPPKRIAIACVGSNSTLAIVEAAVEELWRGTKIILVKAQAHGFGVVNAYRQPEKLGVDRWLALIAAHRYYPSNTCIVDCGTAITVDLLDVSGIHQGGLICPGLRLMKQALSQGTEALPFNGSAYPLQPADFTEAAIYSGTLSAAIGLIEQVLKQQPETVQLILTGGDAELIAEHLLVKTHVDVNLVLKGLAIAADGVL